jgi:hypothetical protein
VTLLDPARAVRRVLDIPGIGRRVTTASSVDTDPN